MKQQGENTTCKAIVLLLWLSICLYIHVFFFSLLLIKIWQPSAASLKKYSTTLLLDFLSVLSRRAIMSLTMDSVALIPNRLAHQLQSHTCTQQHTKLIAAYYTR